MDSSASSRASIASIAHLPRLTETGEINRALPKVPLRVPQKNPRRSLPPGGFPPSGSGPTPYVSPDGSPHPSVPPTPTSPMSPPISPFKTTASDAETNEFHSPRGSVTPQNMAEAEEPEDEKEWIDHRKRRCRFMILVGVFTAIVAALTIGLAVGLSKSSGKSGSKSSSGGSANAVFPAGSYSFDTYLRENSTGCTSRATSWRCYPESASGGSSIGGRATFYWTLQATGPRSYYVSGAENPFAPDFANLAATMLDADQPTERLTFAFSTNKTVVPTDAGAPGSRVARCTYTGTVFQATLWTRRRGGQPFEAPSHPSQYAPWPGDFEVAQYKNSTIGDPVCVDQQGKSIADIQAAGGSCMCRYSSTSMS
ncbi:hypothetical protein LEL_01725 [Akanthomyces lecanii RCEF 1005]|uniref:Tat pathway signal sequence n=1 Tax=Akanthomyces lecanii RCEF 1005 TaxID=1081108 RepID=A0A169YHQ3_CORDF|nr:hypothetical protein LEL_01725 [Akanthomyces lecanii RCEF 1005]